MIVIILYVVVQTLRKAPVPIQIQKLSLRGSDSTWVGDSQGSHYNDNLFYLLLQLLMVIQLMFMAFEIGFLYYNYV